MACANCSGPLRKFEGVSSIYRNGGFLLCPRCWDEEQDLIAVEGNAAEFSDVIEERLERYRSNRSASTNDDIDRDRP